MPDAIALWWEGGQLSYGELDQHANYLAHALRTQGVGPEILIGVCLPRSPHLLICLLAILKAGGAYIPLDPALPPTRLTCLIEDAHLSLILTDTHTSTCLPASRPDLRLLSLDEPSSHLIGRTTRPPQNMCLPANLAYVIYTSGTTGQPKGVAVTHHGLLNLVLNLQRQLHLQAGTRVIQCASLSFDASLLEISLALFTGGSLYLPSSPTLLGTALLHTLNEQAIELAFFTPSLLSTLPRASLPSLHTLLVGGEACPLDLMRTWSQGRRYYNLYGPTEITIFSSCAPCTPDQTCMHLGSPIANTQHYVLDANLQPVPTGVPGELYISGYGLARGYLGHPALTAQCFLPHPFAQQPGERLYRTGDRARWRTDGTIEFLGRNDQQVKLRGHRIELAEIEAILCQQPGIRACLVTLDAHAAHLIAYLLMETPAPTLHTLLPALKQLLPSYMIPSYFVPLDAFPTTIQGKIDYHALPHPTEHHLAHTASQTLPHTETERILATIWQTVLGLTEVHRDDNFFELGGHSLLITHLATEIQDRFDLLLPLSTISQHPTIAALAHVIDQQRQGTPAPQVASVNQRGARR
jgi:amino acid adenylation domain-containing protein